MNNSFRLKAEYDDWVFKTKSDLPYNLWLEKLIEKLRKEIDIIKPVPKINLKSEYAVNFFDEYKNFLKKNPRTKISLENWLMRKLIVINKELTKKTEIEHLKSGFKKLTCEERDYIMSDYCKYCYTDKKDSDKCHCQDDL